MTTDWREQIRNNEKKTRLVIATFLVLYALVGLLMDVFIYEFITGAPLEAILKALITFQVLPYASLMMFVIAGLSLMITYTLYDRLMLLGTDSRHITPESAEGLAEKQLYNVVEEMKVAAGLRYMPKVYLIEADYMNAFASGYSEKSAMVAITRGLLKKLTRSELQAVMAHELSHIRHHDIKLTLMVAILSNIMLMVIDVLFYRALFARNRRHDHRLLFLIILLRYTLPLATLLLALYLSRTREYMADAGSVQLLRDQQPLAKALIKIHRDHQQHAEEHHMAYSETAHEEVRRASYIYDPVKAGFSPGQPFARFFSTHPDLMKRLQALGYQKND